MYPSNNCPGLEDHHYQCVSRSEMTILSAVISLLLVEIFECGLKCWIGILKDYLISRTAGYVDFLFMPEVHSTYPISTVLTRASTIGCVLP